MSEQASTTAAPTGTKIILHWLEKSRAQRILFLLEELSVPYQIKTYKRTKDGLGPPELKQVHPLGKSPLLEVQVPGRKSIVLAESALIVEYLCDYYGKHLIPKRFDAGEEGIGMESEAWLRYKYYMNYAEGSLMPYLVMKLVMNSMFSADKRVACTKQSRRDRELSSPLLHQASYAQYRLQCQL